MTEVESWCTDELGSRLEALAKRLETELAEAATVTRRMYEEGSIREVFVEPNSEHCCPFVWQDFVAGVLQLEVGRGNGGRFELVRTSDDLAFLEDVVDACLEGRVTEIFGPGRSHVEIVLSSGEEIWETGYGTGAGWLPMPGWRQRGAKVQYAPYAKSD